VMRASAKGGPKAPGKRDSPEEAEDGPKPPEGPPPKASLWGLLDGGKRRCV